MRRVISKAPLLVGILSLGACVADVPRDESVRGDAEALAHPGPWAIPVATLAAGDEQYVTYTGAGLWNDGQDCSGSLTPGAGILRTYLLEHFPQIDRIGGYSCRQNTGNTAYMSIHAVGRALDIMLPLSQSSADNDLGDPIGNWLIENAEAIGIQYIIWDEWTWMAARTPGQKGKLYTGPNPHHDHLHVELSAEAGAKTSDWFSGLVVPPDGVECLPIPRLGGTIDDLDPCFTAHGPYTYWRTETGVGYGGSLLWTNAWNAAEPSNWAEWSLTLEEAGSYEVFVYLSAPYAVYGATRYAVRHAGVEEITYLDQALEAGGSEGVFVSLGVYEFAAGGDQFVAVYDDVPTAVPANQHIVVDAVRLVRVGVEMPPEPPVDEPPPVDGEPDPDVDLGEETLAPSRDGGGCSVSPTAQGSPMSLAALVALALVGRRGRRRSA